MPTTHAASRPAVRTRRPARRARPVSQPMEREAGVPLLRLEHAITQSLADSAARESCAELSEYLDVIGAGDAVLEMARVSR
jgi:hypothetical protein